MASLILFIISLITTPVPPELRPAYIAAMAEWYPNVAQVKEVRWCEREECWQMDAAGVAGWWFDDEKLIMVSRSLGEGMI